MNQSTVLVERGKCLLGLPPSPFLVSQSLELTVGDGKLRVAMNIKKGVSTKWVLLYLLQFINSLLLSVFGMLNRWTVSLQEKS